MPTYKDKRLKPCRACGVAPVLESWGSGCHLYAVRCNNPNHPEACAEGFYYSKSRDPEKAIRKWNTFQEKGGIP